MACTCPLNRHQVGLRRMPAFVFGQGRMDSRLRGNDGTNAFDVIPAKAGIHGLSDQFSSQQLITEEAGCRRSGPMCRTAETCFTRAVRARFGTAEITARW